MAPKRTTRANLADTTATTSMTNAPLKAMIDQGVTDALAVRDADRNTNGDDSHNSGMGALMWWNSHVRTVGHDVEYAMIWTDLKKKMTDKMFPEESDKIERYVGGLPDMIHGSVAASRPKIMQEAIEIATELMDKKIHTFAEQQRSGEKKPNGGFKPLCPKCNYHHDGPCAPKCHKCNRVGHLARDYRSPTNTNASNNQRGTKAGQKPTCYKCGAQGHFKRDCPKLKNNNRGNQGGNGNALVKVYVVDRVGTNPYSNVVTGTFLLNNRYASVLFDTSVDRSFVSTAFSSQINITPTNLDHYYDVELADMRIIRLNAIIRGCSLNLLNHLFNIDLMLVELGSLDVIIGMDWLAKYQAVIKYMLKGCPIFLAHVTTKETEDKSEKKQLKDVPIIRKFPEVFPKDLSGLPPTRQVEFQIDLIPGVAPVARAPYRLAPSEMKELYGKNIFQRPHSELDMVIMSSNYSKNKKEDEEHLKAILELHKKEELYAKFSKCEFWLPKCMRTRNSNFPNNSNVTIPRRRNRGRAPNVVEPELRTIVEVALMAERTMEELLRAPMEGYGESIRENPHAHINSFKRITSTLRFRDVQNDVIKLMMFPYSLEGNARLWYEKEPTNSILTWEDLVTKFVNQFFPPSKTTHLKNEISHFTQKFEESFSEAWEGIKEMLRACPHHGFTELTQVDTFYNSLNENDQESLNATAGGNLLSKTTREALNIIENKSKVRYSRNKSNVSRMNTTSGESVSKTDEIINKLADQHSTLVEIVSEKVVTPTSVKAVEEICVTFSGPHAWYNCPNTDNNQASVCAASGSYNQVNPQNRVSNQMAPPGFASMQNNGQNRNYQNQGQWNIFNRGSNFHGNQGFQAQNNHALNFQNQGFQNQPFQVPNNQVQQEFSNEFSSYKRTNDQIMRNMQNQINSLKGEVKNEIQNTMKTQQAVLMNQQNVIQTNLQNMISGFFQNQASTLGTLPNNTIPNPKGEMKAITTRSGFAYEGPSIPTNPSPKKAVERETKETTDKGQSNFQGSTAHIPPLVIPIPIPEPDVPKTLPKLNIPYPSRLDAKICALTLASRTLYF
ncbi:reverse transcriptase domain-containing protein [Tanacetum coccineum]